MGVRDTANPGTIVVDLHGKTVYQARVSLDALLRRATAGTYQLNIIHGCHGGTAIRELLQTAYAHHPKVRRMVTSSDGAVTKLVLREYTGKG